MTCFLAAFGYVEAYAQLHACSKVGTKYPKVAHLPGPWDSGRALGHTGPVRRCAQNVGRAITGRGTASFDVKRTLTVLKKTVTDLVVTLWLLSPT